MDTAEGIPVNCVLDDLRGTTDSHKTMSGTIGKLGKALAAAQGQMTGAAKSSQNPFFRSKYADLASCWDACRDALSKNELAVIQTPEANPDIVIVMTTLVHSSGEWIRGRLSMKPTKSDPQGMGSALTYARRYALAAMVGLAQVDDDGNAASEPNEGLKPEPEWHVVGMVRDAGVVDKRVWFKLEADSEQIFSCFTEDKKFAGKLIKADGEWWSCGLKPTEHKTKQGQTVYQLSFAAKMPEGYADGGKVEQPE